MEKQKRLGDFIRTYTGKMFWPLDARPEEVDIVDIAHALSNMCRFAGHTKEFYCVTPDTKILTLDLRWVRAGDLKIGNELIGFDEHPITPGSSGKNRRRIKPAKVLHDGIILRPVYKITLSDGTILKSSSEHPWLVSTKVSKNQSWITTEQLHKDTEAGHKRYMLRFFNVWPTSNSYADGYAAGIFDGEGHVCFHTGGITTGMAQNEGLVLDLFKKILTYHGVQFSCRKNPRSNTMNLTILGKWQEKVGFLGFLRPIRLLDKFITNSHERKRGMQFDSLQMIEIKKVEYLGVQDVVALETSTHTYFAEGFGAHNSVAEHSILVARQIMMRMPDRPDVVMAALLHDASEAYIMDIPSPVKKHLHEYKAIEAKLMAVIDRAFDIPSYHEFPIIKEMDIRVLATEQRDLMIGSSLDGVPLDSHLISCWSPGLIESRFLSFFRYISEKLDEYRKAESDKLKSSPLPIG